MTMPARAMTTNNSLMACLCRSMSVLLASNSDTSRRFVSRSHKNAQADVNWCAVELLCFSVANPKDSKQIGLSARVDTQTAAGESIPVIGEATGDFPPKKVEEGTGRSALMVGAGILISRIIGVIRQRVFAHYQIGR